MDFGGCDYNFNIEFPYDDDNCEYFKEGDEEEELVVELEFEPVAAFPPSIIQTQVLKLVLVWGNDVLERISTGVWIDRVLQSTQKTRLVCFKKKRKRKRETSQFSFLTTVTTTTITNASDPVLIYNILPDIVAFAQTTENNTRDNMIHQLFEFARARISYFTDRLQFLQLPHPILVFNPPFHVSSLLYTRGTRAGLSFITSYTNESMHHLHAMIPAAICNTKKFWKNLDANVCSHCLLTSTLTAKNSDNVIVLGCNNHHLCCKTCWESKDTTSGDGELICFHPNHKGYLIYCK